MANAVDASYFAPKGTTRACCPTSCKILINPGLDGTATANARATTRKVASSKVPSACNARMTDQYIAMDKSQHARDQPHAGPACGQCVKGARPRTTSCQRAAMVATGRP